VNITAQELQEGQIAPDRLAEAVRAFRDTGLLVLDDVYSPEFIADTRAAYEVELERHIWSKGGLDALIGKTFGTNHIGFFPPLTLPIADPLLVAHPLVVQILTELLGKDAQCSFYHTNTAYPGSGYQPIHRDSPQLFGTQMSVAHPVTSLVLNVPLVDFTVKNGSTEVWPGTHLIVDSDPADGRDLEARAALLPSVRMNIKAGSLALRDMRAWHRGTPNNADYPRTMLAIVYHRGWLAEKTVSIPQSTWDAWPEAAKHIFRKNSVIPDVQHKPITWDER
jgi:ectoine hydroxylase-related dioxygenase (phytanoyl-CoA dioxygenase family)